MEQLDQGVEPGMVVFEKGLPTVRNRSVGWLVNGYKAIDKPDLVKKVRFKVSHITTTYLRQD